MTPTARSLQQCSDLGLIAEKVEQRVPGSRFVFTRDLFNVIDIVALGVGQTGLLGIQATTTAHISHRFKKILDEPKALLWLTCGNRLEIWGWAKRGPRGKRKTWQLTRKAITKEDWPA